MDYRAAVGAIVMSLDLARGAWPISLLALAAAIWGIYALAKARKLRAWQSLTVLGSLVLPAIVVPIYTVRFWADPNIHSPATQELPLKVLGAIWLLFAIAIAVSIYCARDFRLPLSGFASAVVWFAAGMYLVSAMAVSGVWL